MFGLYAFSSLLTKSFSEAAPDLVLTVNRFGGKVGQGRVRYSTGVNDTAIIGVNFDLFNVNNVTSATSNWLYFGDGQNASSIIVRFRNTAHNATNSSITDFVGLSLLLSQCQTYDLTQDAWLPSPGCSIDTNNDFEAIDIVDECTYILCEHGGFCADIGTAQPVCVCTPGYQGPLCESLVPTAPPNPSTSVAGGRGWIIAVIVCGTALIIFALAFLIWSKRRRQKKAHLSFAQGHPAAFINPIYDAGVSSELHIPDLSASEYQDLPPSSHYDEPKFDNSTPEKAASPVAVRASSPRSSVV